MLLLPLMFHISKFQMVFYKFKYFSFSGPRKDKDNDTELGEDATGILNTQYGTFFGY